MVNICSPGTGELETGASDVACHSDLHAQLEAIWDAWAPASELKLVILTPTTWCFHSTLPPLLALFGPISTVTSIQWKMLLSLTYSHNHFLNRSMSLAQSSGRANLRYTLLRISICQTHMSRQVFVYFCMLFKFVVTLISVSKSIVSFLNKQLTFFTGRMSFY